MIQGVQPIEEILKEITEEIYIFLHQQTPEDPNVIEARGASLQSYIARLVKMLADCKYRKDIALHNVIKVNHKEVGSTVMKSYCESECQDENYMVTLVDGLLKKCYAENDWNRTLMSKAKEEYRVNNQPKSNPQ